MNRIPPSLVRSRLVVSWFFLSVLLAVLLAVVLLVGFGVRGIF
jgi:hypothetical protein